LNDLFEGFRRARRAGHFRVLPGSGGSVIQTPVSERFLPEVAFSSFDE
jgi:hypothetical protein